MATNKLTRIQQLVASRRAKHAPKPKPKPYTESEEYIQLMDEFKVFMANERKKREANKKNKQLESTK